MRRRTALLAVGLLAAGIVLLGYFIRRGTPEAGPTGQEIAKPYRRIVSFAPSITEVLFALGLGDRVVGVTRYCDHPPAAKTRAQIGGHYDPNYEAVVALQPDLIVTLDEHVQAREHLARFGMNFLKVDHKTVAGIMESIPLIGQACGVRAQADSMVRDIQRRMDRIRTATVGKPRPRVMVAIGRNMGSATMEDVYIAGEDGFFSEMIRLAGGENAYDRDDVRFPIVTAEGILRINPAAIIDMVTDLEEQGLTREDVVRQWQSVAQAQAVRSGRVHVLTGDYIVIPGPRFVRIVEDMAHAIHPDLQDLSSEHDRSAP